MRPRFKKRMPAEWPSSAASGVLGVLGVLTGCGAPGAPAITAGAAAPPNASAAPSAHIAALPTSNPLASSPAPAPFAPGVNAGPRARLPEIVLDPKQPVRALPELKVENIGLHIGGGPNDAETKAPFLRAVSVRFPEFADCYRKNEEPAKGGRFGIDLHIARTGGHARLEQPRTAMPGPEFRACVSAVFESVEFEKPKRGATTISYSLHFTVGEGT